MDSTYFWALLVASGHHLFCSEEDRWDSGVVASWIRTRRLGAFVRKLRFTKSVLNIILKRQAEKDTDGGDAGQSRSADGESERQDREAVPGVGVDSDWTR